MTSRFPAPRAAEEFDRVLAGTATRPVTDRHADLLATVEAIRSVPAVTPRPEFAADLRSRLMLAAATELAPAPTVVRDLTTARTRRRRAGTLAASLVIVGGTAGMAAAAAGSVPGEALYPLKRGGEQVNTAVRLTDAAKGQAELGSASTRLEEMRVLIGDDAEASLLQDTLGSFEESATDGADRLFAAFQRDGETEHVEAVRQFAAEQMAVLADLASDARPSTADLLVEAADTLAQLDQQARVLCAACGAADPLEAPAALTAGAAAASVDNLLARPVEQVQADVLATARAEHLRLEQLKTLQQAAEEQAGITPTFPLPGTSGDGTGSATTLTSTLTKDGVLVPSLRTSTTAVGGLVDGVTGTLATTDTGVPLVDGTVDGLTGTVDGATGSLLP